MNAAPSRILVVEDSDTQALQLRLMLEDRGFATERASSAEDAIEQMSRSQPDLLVVDYHLPGMNGEELVRLVRLNGEMRTLPVLLLTAGATRELERQGLDSGANAYIPKSADRALLLGRIDALLRAPRDARERSGIEGLRRARMLVIGAQAARGPIEALLESEGYGVGAVMDPDAMEQALDERTPDCILIQIDDPAFDGIALCRALDQRRGSDQHFQIVAFGGAGAGSEGALRGFAAGADDVLQTGDERETLAARIRAVVRRKYARDEERRAAERERERETALARARAEAAGAEALSIANEELAAANARLSATQAQLVQAAKMASLGELVAGIAHEINNPLSFILAHQATVRRLVGEALPLVADGGEAKLARAADRLDAMQSGLGRIQQLVIKLRRFSRLDEGERVATDIPESIDAVLTLLAPKLGDAITIEKSYEAPATLICSAGLINQVVMNILSNAADALPDGGTISIATRLADARYDIILGDSGPGVPADVRARIFEPFFTTKEIGVGTGLGLAIAYGVVRSHGGDIAIDESPLGGAQFTVSVPVTPP